MSSGFRTSIKFPYDHKEYIANQTFLETELVFPRDIVSADIILLDPGENLERIYNGLDFDLLINSNTIGSGLITNLYPLKDKKI